MTSPESIDTIVDRHQTELLRYAMGILRDVHLAQDAVQKAFIKLVETRNMPKGNTRAWLFRVVRNDCLNQIRKNRKMLTVETIPETPETAAAGPDRELAASDDRALVLAALDKLNSRVREVVLLKFREHLSYREIAEVTGYSVSRVGVILFDAIRELRRECRREWEGEA